MLPDSVFVLLLHGTKQDSGNGTFLRETSRSPKAKGGMPHESDGDSYASDVHPQRAELDGRCGSTDP